MKLLPRFEKYSFQPGRRYHATRFEEPAPEAILQLLEDGADDLQGFAALVKGFSFLNDRLVTTNPQHAEKSNGHLQRVVIQRENKDGGFTSIVIEAWPLGKNCCEVFILTAAITDGEFWFVAGQYGIRLHLDGTVTLVRYDASKGSDGFIAIATPDFIL